MIKTVDCLACGQYRPTAYGADCMLEHGHRLYVGTLRENGIIKTLVFHKMPEMECPKVSTPARTAQFMAVHKPAFRNIPMLHGEITKEELEAIALTYEGAIVFNDGENVQEIWIPLTDEEKKNRVHALRVANYTGSIWHG